MSEHNPNAWQDGFDAWQNGYDDAYGARPLARAIQHYVEDAVADEILNGNVKEGETIEITLDKEKQELVLKLKYNEITKSNYDTEIIPLNQEEYNSQSLIETNKDFISMVTEKFDITNNIKMSLADSLSILSAIAKNEGYHLNDLITVFNQ